VSGVSNVCESVKKCMRVSICVYVDVNMCVGCQSVYEGVIMYMRCQIGLYV
jgi:hypothetical protein